MAKIEYKVYFDGQSTSADVLSLIEDIIVEQEVDLAWEAQVRMIRRSSADGCDPDVDADYLTEGTRVRVEITLGDAVWTPLIDGPVIGVDSSVSADPGNSFVTMKVQDDSYYLHKDDAVQRFENVVDSDVAVAIFGDVAEIDSHEVEATPAPTEGLEPVVVQRGSQMQLLRALAKRNGMKAYVLPGDDPGKSIGVFKRLPTEVGAFAPLALGGSGRNVASFEVANDSRQVSSVSAAGISSTDKSVTRATVDASSVTLLGSEPATSEESSVAARMLSPCQSNPADPEQAATAAVEASSYAYKVSGEILGHCYGSVLRPYEVISVTGANEKLSGDYQITEVVHSLGRSEYKQSFRLQRNATSSANGGGSLLEEIF